MSHRLVLVRHAQAADAGPRGDHERVLTARGEADAAELGRWLARQGLGPDHVLVSTAARARKTWDALAAQVGDAVDADRVWHERRVYDGGVEGVLAAIREVPDATGVLWVVGHEPVMSATAGSLAGRRSAVGLVQQVGRGVRTATAAVLEVPGDWVDVHPGEARLLAVHTGRAAGL